MSKNCQTSYAVEVSGDDAFQRTARGRRGVGESQIDLTVFVKPW
jgi:hypothetical protein